MCRDCALEGIRNLLRQYAALQRDLAAAREELADMKALEIESNARAEAAEAQLATEQESHRICSEGQQLIIDKLNGAVADLAAERARVVALREALEALLQAGDDGAEARCASGMVLTNPQQFLDAVRKARAALATTGERP